MSDFADIQNLIASTTSTEEQIVQLVDKQLISVPDVNNGGYSSYIQIDTLNFAPDLYKYSDARLVIPVSIGSSTGTPYTGLEAIAVRGSLLSFIWGHRVIEMVSNNELVNETNMIYYWNNFRLLFQRTRQWLKTEGMELLVQVPEDRYNGADILTGFTTGFGTDMKFFNPVAATHLFIAAASGGAVTTDGAAIPAASAGYTGTLAYNTALALQGAATAATAGQYTSNFNNSYNGAFEEGVRQFKYQFPFNATTHLYEGMIVIPLWAIHDFWENVMSVASKNVRFNLQFLCSPMSASASNPLGQYPWLTTAPGVIPPITKICDPNMTSVTLKTCALYAHKLTLPPAAYEEWAKKVEQGYFYKRSYTVTNTPTASITAGIQTSAGPFALQLTTGIVSATAVLLLATPTGWTNGTNAQYMAAYPTPPMTAVITNYNIQLDNGNYIQQGITYGFEFWEYMKDAFPSNITTDGFATLFNWNMFQYMRYPYVDIQRQRTGKDPKLARAITATVSRSDTQGAVDYIPIITSLNTVIFNFSKEKTLVQKFIGVV